MPRPAIPLALATLAFVAAALTAHHDKGHAAFPGANGDLVIESSRDGDYQIFRINSDGTNPRKLTTEGDNFEAMWSPDGARIAFSRAPEGNDNASDIWVMNADGTDQIQLTDDPEQDSLPGWSADGSQIAFRRGSTEASQIWIMDADGENEDMLVDLAGTDTTPAFSPDGTKLAFAHRPFGQDFEIYIANADGTDPEPITENDTLDRAPNWSPDSARLAYECEPVAEEPNEVCVIDANGQNQDNITNNPALDDRPAWSPDGTLIAFYSTRSEPFGIYTMEPDGDNVQPVTNQDDHDPDWQPLVQAVTWGDNNCSGEADPVDALFTLRYDAGLTTDTGDCPEMGQAVQILAAAHAWGDFDCSDAVDPVDGLKILRFDAGLDVARPDACPNSGQSVVLS